MYYIEHPLFDKEVPPKKRLYPQLFHKSFARPYGSKDPFMRITRLGLIVGWI